MKELLIYPLTLQTIRRSHSITLPQLAEQAGVTSHEVYLLEIGATVPQEQTERILAALTTLTGEPLQQRNDPVPVPDQPTLLLPTLPIRKLRRGSHATTSTIAHHLL